MSMTWYDKLVQVIADCTHMPRLKLVFRSFPPAVAGYVAKLRQEFPFISEDYTRFSSLTDGASLWMYEVYGSGASKMPSLACLHVRWQPNAEKLRAFPFAEDPGGNCIAMRENGEIVQFDLRAESDSDCITLAPCFGELLDNVLMGERFDWLFDVPPSEIEDNEWLAYLRHKGWLSPCIA